MMVRMFDTSLQGTEKATSTGDGQDHVAEFALDFLPGLQRDAFDTAGSSSKMKQSSSCQLGGSSNVLQTVSMMQPRRSLVVAQQPSPSRSFLVDIGSW
jgi:hypothetical protein